MIPPFFDIITSCIGIFVPRVSEVVLIYSTLFFTFNLSVWSKELIATERLYADLCFPLYRVVHVVNTTTTILNYHQ